MGIHNRHLNMGMDEKRAVERAFEKRCVDIMVLDMGMGRDCAKRWVTAKLRWMDAAELYRHLMSRA